MKRILIYIAALALLTLAPIQGTDIGSLHPVEVVLVSGGEDTVTIATDTGDRGEGTDVQAALQNLKDTTPGTVYLDTAEYLLITKGAETEAEQLRQVLKKSVQVCMADPEVKLDAVAKFLPAHGPLPRLEDWKPGDKLSYLRVFEERFLLT